MKVVALYFLLNFNVFSTTCKLFFITFKHLKKIEKFFWKKIFLEKFIFDQSK